MYKLRKPSLLDLNEKNMEINIYLFGQLCEIAGGDRLVMHGVKDTDELQIKLKQQFPGFAASKYLIAIDKKMIRENTPINGKNDIALLPPFSGG